MYSKKYFIANWKMNGEPKDLDRIYKIEKFLKNFKKKFNLNCIFCLPFTLLGLINNKKISVIKIGSQNITASSIDYGAFTGSVSAKMVRQLGCKYAIIGHSEIRNEGETSKDINKKIEFASTKNLKVILCVGETLNEFKNKKSFNKVKSQIYSAFKDNQRHLGNIVIAYEPIWSIGTGIIPKKVYLDSFFKKIKDLIRKDFKKNVPVLYGGSVSSKNISSLKNIDCCDGFLIGGASLKTQNFIDIIKKYYN